jgi:uncharacterized protein YecE (DUF72 family)
MARIFIATAGWSIPRVQAAAFPREGSGLERYARVLGATEINSTFWRRHRPATRLPGWRAFFYKLFQASSGAQTVERDSWKLYASAIAANFIARWLASPWGPELS